MKRRDFLRGVTAATVPTLLGARAYAAGAGGDRHGDLLLRRLASDHLEVLFTPQRPRPLRVLQVADTHFHPGGETERTERTLRRLVESERPDLVVHSGDFVNNDSGEPVEWSGLDVMNGLGKPWTLCFGNHDYPVRNAEGSRSFEEIRLGMERGYQGHADLGDRRRYCYRYDLTNSEGGRPSACLFFFQVGYAEGDRRVSDDQLVWFVDQMSRDRERGVKAPITVFVHIPVREFNDLYQAGEAVGEHGEAVCYDSDTGETFRRLADTGRVSAVFCGHDHVNNFHGRWRGIELSYGRVSGWGAYGPADWRRGGRLITLDLASPRPETQHHEVFA
ncbi:phosphodiesterase YaeI [Pseudobythopirellula maris]|uniref:Phosphodiesterase YaeI n=1 Tax=Pseudobythopirellula maris TaxID=2527991 RepID=A0A5C5ZPJ6_9BACT|nr:metallophosphoesterase [Pseudobythopirellula maris]TWT89096.1 phosphodiesterase YaeI [Pseudobythopirellula maris]